MSVNEKMTNIANAIREKTGETEKLSLDEMANAITNLPSGGGDLDALLNDTITEIESNVTTVRKYSCYYCTNLTKASFPEATGTLEYVFMNCTALQEVNLPKVTKLGGSLFKGCTSLHTVIAPSVVDNGLSTSTFYGCTALKSFSCNSTTVGGQCFYQAGVESIDLPLVEAIGVQAFYKCTSLTNVNLPSLTQIGQNSFSYCSALSYLDLPVCISIDVKAFQYCTALSALVLRYADDVVTLNSTNVFTGSTIASGTGYVYVPSALVNTYKSATNWSLYAEQIRAIEDYPEITGG